MIIGLLDLQFPIRSTLAVMLISPALILQPAVFPRSIVQVIISAAAEVRPPPPHVTAASSAALLPTIPPAPSRVTLKFIKDGITSCFPVFAFYVFHLLPALLPPLLGEPRLPGAAGEHPRRA